MKGNKNKKFLSEKLKIYMQMFFLGKQRRQQQGVVVWLAFCVFFNFMAQVGGSIPSEGWPQLGRRRRR